MEQNIATPQEWFGDSLYSPFHIGSQNKNLFFNLTSAAFNSLVPNECSERSLQLKYFLRPATCCRHLPVARTLHPLTGVQENKRLAGEPPSLAQTCRQHEPRSALPGANLSCVMTKLFVPVVGHKHRYYSLRIHMTFNLLQYTVLQSMIIFLHVSDFFPLIT